MDYSNLKIDRLVSFKGFIFLLRFKSSNSCWGHRSTFESATFTKGANFLSATFAKGASFGSTTFIEGANFRSATFNRGANFYQARIGGNWVLKNARFQAQQTPRKQGLSAQLISVEGFADLSADQEADDPSLPSLNLENATFKAGLKLKGRKFGSVPQFRGATLNANFEVDDREDAWPRAQADIPQQDYESYEQLRSLMGAFSRRGLELLFLKQEYQAQLLVLKKNKTGWLPSQQGIVLWWFWFLNDYGRNFWRPLVLWVMVTIAFFGVNFAVLQCVELKSLYGLKPAGSTISLLEQGQMKTALAYQLSGAGALTVVPPPRFEAALDSSFWYGVLLLVNALQRIVSGLLLFLFAMAVRNRLRLSG